MFPDVPRCSEMYEGIVILSEFHPVSASPSPHKAWRRHCGGRHRGGQGGRHGGGHGGRHDLYYCIRVFIYSYI